jgi:predicted MFS family arabinose efflux permease
MMIAAVLLGALTMTHHMPPRLMLGFLFLIGAGYAMMNPTLLAVLPELVSPAEIRSALALNGLNMNIARVMGPLVGGLIVVLVGSNHFYAGKGLAFMATGISLLGVVWVVYRWNPPPRKRPEHPETVLGAIGTGLRYTALTPPLLAILARIFIFIVCAGIAPTLAGIMCKKEPRLHGDFGAMIWMISFGLGAIIGVYQMQKLQRRFGIEEVVAICTIGFGLAALGVAYTPWLWLGCFAMAAAGFSWVIVPTNFNISTQLAVPAWIKGRAMGMYVLVLWGAFAVGSAFFASMNKAYGPRGALARAGIGVLLGAIPILWLRLVPKHKQDFAPAKPGPLPQPESIADSSAPLRVTVSYRIPADRQHDFHRHMRHLRTQRLRNGARRWRLRSIDGNQFAESFIFPSWPARVRHAERTTRHDFELQQTIRALHDAPDAPAITYAAAEKSTPRPAVRGNLLDRLTDAFDREFVRFFDRMASAHERDPLRFRPRPPVKILRLPRDPRE